MLQIPASSGRSSGYLQRRELKLSVSRRRKNPASDHTILERRENISPINSHEFKSYTQNAFLFLFSSLPARSFLFSRGMKRTARIILHAFLAHGRLYLYSLYSRRFATFTFSLIIRSKFITPYTEGNVYEEDTI